MSLNKYCSRCGNLTSINNIYCPTCTKKKEVEDLIENRKNYKRYNKERYKDSNKLMIKRFYGSAIWRDTRERVLIRDSYLCVKCLSKGLYIKAQTVHHIIEIEEDWEKRLDIDNLISLCNICHNKEHNRW